MLRYSNYNIVFQEIPGEVTLAVNLSNCPNRCKGCHSPYLQQNIGEILDNESLDGLLNKYGNSITCVCFMGGDSNPKEIEKMSVLVHQKTKGNIKTGWYSGKDILPENISVDNFDYIKIGAYIESCGGLDNPDTNQRFYMIDNGKMIDKTHLFQQKKLAFSL